LQAKPILRVTQAKAGTQRVLVQKSIPGLSLRCSPY